VAGKVKFATPSFSLISLRNKSLMGAGDKFDTAWGSAFATAGALNRLSGLECIRQYPA
jgi:hypothetical protein